MTSADNMNGREASGVAIELTEAQAQRVAATLGRRHQSATRPSLAPAQRLLVDAAAGSPRGVAEQPGPLARILKVLAAFSPDQARGVTEVSRKLGYSKTTVHRCVCELVEQGLLIQDPDSRRYYRARERRST
jgi:biotin operon repressor